MAQATPYRNPMTNPGRGSEPTENPIHGLVRQAAAKYRIPEALLAAVVQKESSFNPRAVGSRGEIGLMQLMPQMVKALGVQDPMDPAQNLDGGARHLSYLLNKYGGSMSLALAAYNAGEPAVDKVKGIPNIPSTVAYVREIADIVNQAGGARQPMEKVTQVASKTPPGYPTPFPNAMTRPGPAPVAPQPQAPAGQRTPPGYPTPYPNPMTRPAPGGLPPTSRPIDQLELVPPTSVGRVDRLEPEGGPGTVSGLTGMSNQQLDQLVQAYGTDVDQSRQYNETQMPAGERAFPQGGSAEPSVPDQGYQQPSIAPFFSGGTFPQPQAPGLGGISKLFKPSGGRTFADEPVTPSGR